MTQDDEARVTALRGSLKTWERIAADAGQSDRERLRAQKMVLRLSENIRKLTQKA